jgi:hypothetical protein
VVDDELAGLTLTIARDTVSETAGSVVARLSRNADTTGDLVVTLLSDDISEATVPATATIADGAASVRFDITIIDDVEVDGTQTATITAEATGFENTDATVTVIDDDLPGLTLVPVPESISENGGSAVVTVTRSGSTTNALTLNLESSDTSEATVPSTLLIPAGAASAEFDVMAVDDLLVDGAQIVTLRAGANGVTPGIVGIEVTDDDSALLTLVVNPDEIPELNGGAAIATISRNTDMATPLAVTLANSDESEATIPAAVTIPAGQGSATFAINAIDDALIDGDQPVTVTASAANFPDAEVSIMVLDSGETGRLTLELDPTSMSENGGSSTATVARNGDVSADLIVNLLSNDSTEVKLPTPPTVTIVAGQNLATFTITAVDDNIVDGTQTVIISAKAPNRPTATASLEVTDDDALALTLAVDPDRIFENGGISVATVTRNTTDLSNPLTVTLSNSDPNAAMISATVVIPADQASANFLVRGIDNDVSEQDRTVTITAEATGFASGSIDILILDNEPIFSDQFEN